jgi:hypothetical protein
LPSAGAADECPRCHRRGKTLVPKPGQPHIAMGRKWCPGKTEFDYVYFNGHLFARRPA